MKAHTASHLLMLVMHIEDKNLNTYRSQIISGGTQLARMMSFESHKFFLKKKLSKLKTHLAFRLELPYCLKLLSINGYMYYVRVL